MSEVSPFSGEKKEYYNTGLNKFVNEAKSLAKFYALPGIVAVKDFFRENGTAYIVMEFVDGVTLKQRLAQLGGKMPADEALSMMRPLMKSLAQVHTTGIIHRDISPDNIMLTKSGEVKLLDFGAARDYVSDNSKTVQLKPGYAPEEQYRTRGVQGPWTDVYALCATIYRMITGETPPESLERKSEDPIIPPSRKGAQITNLAENALLKGLAVMQKDRFQNVGALYNALYSDEMQSSREPVRPERTVTEAEAIVAQYQQELEQANARADHAIASLHAQLEETKKKLEATDTGMEIKGEKNSSERWFQSVWSALSFWLLYFRAEHQR